MSRPEFESDNNPVGLDAIDTAEFTLSQPGYEKYEDYEKVYLLGRIGCTTILRINPVTGEVTS